MAYTASTLYLSGGGAPGFSHYLYQTTDTMATVLPLQGTGYFTFAPGTVSGPKLVAGDRIFCQCSDGNMWLKVASVTASSGAVVCQYAGGNLPIRTWATGTAAGDFGMSPGYYEIDTNISTGTRGVLPVPYPGIEVKIYRPGSATQGVTIDAGASASNISWVDGTVGGGTVVVWSSATGFNRRFLTQAQGEWIHLVGTSTSRYRVQGYFFQGSAVSEGGSVEMGAGT